MKVADVSEWIDNFRFTVGVTPLSTFTGPFLTVFIYFVINRLLPRYMASRKPADIPRILVAHNLFLSFSSLVLFIVQAQALWKQYHGLGYLICSPKVYDNGLLHLVWYLNYLLKYYELLDTVFLIIRKKPVLFLHEYHHSATLLLAWAQQREHSTAQWVPIFLNLAVHVLMYYYYAMAVLKIRKQQKSPSKTRFQPPIEPKDRKRHADMINHRFENTGIWWKKHLTTMQIMQFVLDVAAITYAYVVFLNAGMDENA